MAPDPATTLGAVTVAQALTVLAQTLPLVGFVLGVSVWVGMAFMDAIARILESLAAWVCGRLSQLVKE